MLLLEALDVFLFLQCISFEYIFCCDFLQFNCAIKIYELCYKHCTYSSPTRWENSRSASGPVSILGWVIFFGRVNHLGLQAATEVNLAWPSLCTTESLRVNRYAVQYTSPALVSSKCKLVFG